MADSRKRRAPAASPEAREDQLTALALNAMEERIRSGKATGAELVYLAKLGSVDTKLEREARSTQQELMKAKTKAIKAMENQEKLYEEAIAAFKSYGGKRDD
jgi:hypothetical protein